MKCLGDSSLMKWYQVKHYILISFKNDCQTVLLIRTILMKSKVAVLEMLNGMLVCFWVALICAKPEVLVNVL